MLLHSFYRSSAAYRVRIALALKGMAFDVQPVNLAAIQEFEEEQKRKEYLDAQNDDLCDALATLENAIAKIDRKTRTRFKETFERVNKGVQELFPRLFGGGHAYLELTGEDQYRISLAVAGFSADELDIEVKENRLTVTGKKADDASERHFMHRGIATRGFQRAYQLADYVRVQGADLKDGLLHIDLVREVPEAMKPRRIEIRGQDDKLIESEVQAVRVSPEEIMNRGRLDHLMAKTADMLSSLEPGIPADLYRRARIEVRHEFFADGYARSNEATDTAIEIARDALGLELETTYTGKAMAALLHDARQASHRDASLMFWNTYNSNPLPEIQASTIDRELLPAEFLRYFE